MSARERAIAASGQRVSPAGDVRGYGASGFRDGGSEAESFAIVDAPTAYVEEVIPQATLQDVTRAREEAIRGANLLGANTIGGLLNFFGYDPRQAALAQTERLMRMPNAYFDAGRLTAPIAGGGYLRQGTLGNVTYTGMPQPDYNPNDPFARLIRGDEVGYGARGFREDKIAPVDEVTGQCPDGYEFDENLNACRKITPTEYTAMTMPSVPAGRYARMGLLDQPPAGLLEAGFGSPADFAGANLAFRRATAPMSTYFTDPRSYEGYTLI